MKKMVGVVIMCVLLLPLFAFGRRDKVEAAQLQQVTVQEIDTVGIVDLAV